MNMFFRKLKNHFIPHKDNEYKPHLLRHQSALFFFLLIIVVELGFLAQVFLVFDKTKFLASVLPGVLTSLTNDKRIENNTSSLSTNILLEKAAQLKANDMANRGYFSHNTPDGKTPWYWLDQVGYKYKYAGENLAINFFESKDVAEAWMNSPSHRANMIKDVYTEIGIAVASGFYQGYNTVFVVQFFGTPKVATVLPTTETNSKNLGTQIAQKPLSTQTPVNNPAIQEVTIQNTSNVLSENITIAETNTTKNETKEIPIDQNTEIKKDSAFLSFIKQLLTSPRHTTNSIFASIMALVLFVLLLIIFIKSEIKHPIIILRGVFLISVIVILFFVNLNISSNQTKLPIETTTASIIAS
jgi:hypothetical protein